MATTVAEDYPNTLTASFLPVNNIHNANHHSSPTPTPNKRPRTSSILAISLLLVAGIVIGIAGSSAFSSSSSSLSSPSLDSAITSLKSVIKQSFVTKKLRKPVVILISSDGFRFGYQLKTRTPNINSLIASGTEADKGLIPVFPTMTFPNHYSIATGQYPAYHGIVNNYFVDPVTGDPFSKSDVNPKWWIGEAIWVTVANNGLKASTYYWPGSEVKKGNWTCPPQFCKHFNSSNLDPFEQRVDTILGYFDLPRDEVPSFMTLYLQDPDSQGHNYGPDDPRVTEAVAHVDKTIGRLIKGLKKKKIFDQVHIILVGDHGMVGTCESKLIALDDFAPWINIPAKWVQTYSPLLTIRPPAGVSAADVVAKIKQGLKSGNVVNSEYLKIYLKEELPDRLVYKDSDRITPIVGLVAEGFTLKQSRKGESQCGGTHGYDNAYMSMRSIFIGHGPRFSKGCKFPSFLNVEIYNVVTSILGIPGAANNGTATFPQSIFSCRPYDDVDEENEETSA